MDRSKVGYESKSTAKRLLLQVCVIAVVAAGLAFLPSPARTGHADAGESFLQPHPVVVLADRPVCSLLSGYKLAAGITGQDGAASISVDGTVYWAFGDTTMADGGMLPNALGKSDDMDASDCISLVPNSTDGRAEAFLPPVEGELTVWPGEMVSTEPGSVHVVYASVVRHADSVWRVAGVGLASFDTATLTPTRVWDGALLWRDGGPMPSQMFSDGAYVYFLLHASRDRWTVDVLLARVPSASIESPASYEYWQPATVSGPGQWLTDLWDESTGSWDMAISDLRPVWKQYWLKNGGGVAYNEFVGRWLAVYASDLLSAVRIRTAPDLTGPWEDSDTLGVDCTRYHPQVTVSYLCYAGTQHTEYTRDGGRTIYVSYANSDTYQVYLHEIRLGAPVHQWTDEAGRATFTIGDAAGPAGSTEDGVSFYASDIPVPGLSEIHGWEDEKTGSIRYGPFTPGDNHRDLGVEFYAPGSVAEVTASNASYAPVYRWTRSETERYSMLDLGQLGYVQQEFAFYGSCPDTDTDRLSDCTESFLGTDVANADTDGDGLDDGFEYSRLGCSPLTYTDDGDGIPAFDEFLIRTNPCLADTDGDGCPDGAEVGADPRAGGLRNPTNLWDFFDLPNANGVRDGIVNIRDISQIIRRYGKNDSGGTAPVSRTTDPFTPPGASSSYHPAFDRSLVQDGSRFRLGPPDGGITVFEIMRVVEQYGDTCRA